MRKANKRKRLKKKIRVKVTGTKDRPRLSVFRSNKFIYAQVINDEAGKVLAEASDLPRVAKTGGKAGVKTSAKVVKGTKTDRAKEVGRTIAKATLAVGIDKIVFDRNGFKYTGRVKLVADEARAGGLKF